MKEATYTFTPASIRQLAVIAIPDGFLFIDTDREDAQPIVLSLKAPIDFPDAFEQFVIDSGLADQPSMRVNVSEHSNRFMVMPTGLGQPEQLQELFHAAFMENEWGELYQFPLSDSKQLFVCELQKKRIDTFSRTFLHLHIYNPTHLLTEWTLQQAKTCNESVLLAYCYGKNLHISVAKPDKLLFSNAFVAKTQRKPPITIYGWLNSYNWIQSPCMLLSARLTIMHIR